MLRTESEGRLNKKQNRKTSLVYKSWQFRKGKNVISAILKVNKKYRGIQSPEEMVKILTKRFKEDVKKDNLLELHVKDKWFDYILHSFKLVWLTVWSIGLSMHLFTCVPCIGGCFLCTYLWQRLFFFSFSFISFNL